LRIYRDFCDFQHGGCRHLEFSKIQNFNDLSAVAGQYASLCQISSKSVKQLVRYGDFTVFIMAAVGVADVITCTKFFGDRSRGVYSVGVKNCHFPLTKPVAVNTGLALPRSP